MLFDTHAHYDDSAFDEDRDALLSSLPAQGVGYVTNIGCDAESSRFAVALAEKYPHVYAAIGVHPHVAAKAVDADYEELRRLVRACPKVRAIGEIGLDYHYDFAPRDVQREVFARQMELARDLNLPVCIHDREAHADCFDVVRAYPEVRGVFHCYSGSLEYARPLLKLGWLFSFTGVITFKNARKFADILRALPLESMLVETDCPYLTPEPFRGRRNDSTFVRYTAAKLAEIRGIAPEEAESATTENAKRFYGVT